MKEFSFREAWTHGLNFFSGRTMAHSIILIGLGLVIPMILHLLLIWTTDGGSDPSATETAGRSGARLLASVAGYVFQTGAFFASWRLGLVRGESVGAALLFGLLAGLVTSVGFGVALVAVGFAFSKITVLVAAGAVLVVFVALFGLVWTAYSAMFAVAICLMFLLSLAVGATIGDMTYSATIVGGSGFVWTLLVAASFVLLWLAARFSCTAVLMAERRSLNLWAAMRESWSLTWDDEWRITRYLGLLGLALALGFLGAIFLTGFAVVRLMPEADPQVASLLGGSVVFILSVPVVYLSVMVPVGIYRALSPADVARAEVFV